MRQALRLVAALVLLSGPALAASSWLKPYSLEAYAEIWHIRLKVNSLSRAMPEIIKTLEKNGGQSTIPLSNAVASKLHGYQQLSFRFTKRGAERAVRRLRKQGAVDVEPPMMTGVSDPQVSADIDNKLKELKTETAENRDALTKMPAVAALTQELVDHLTDVKKTREDAKDRVLVNFEISEEAAAASR